MPATSSRTRSRSNTRSKPAATGLPEDTILQLYETMYRIRVFEERTQELFKEGLVKGTAHLYIGQEAVAAGTCANLTQADYVGSYHRGHGHCIAKGADFDRMMAELMGRDTGYCRGLGGSMHIADLDLNILGANGVVGATMPLGAGAALAAKLRKEDRVAVAFFGDGASNQGTFHESLNLASVWKLPMVFVCENNQFALTTPYAKTTSVRQVASRGVGYDVPAKTIDGNNVIEVYQEVGAAIRRARAGEGPSLVEAMTWRWGNHSIRANLNEPRTAQDMAAWKARCPLVFLEKHVRDHTRIDPARLEQIRARVMEELEASVEFARSSPEPSAEIFASAVYAPSRPVAAPEPATPGSRNLTFGQAVNEAMAQAMARDPSVFVMGEDIVAGGIFQATTGLVERFGPERVRDTPISESTFCGTGVGAAIAGMRPVVEVQIFDFTALMMDMLVNQAAKFRFMNGGKAKVPFVIRGPQGGGIRMAAQHSQSLETWFAHIPGLIVVAPSNAYDAKGLLSAAIRSDNPVIFLEHKMLYLAPPVPVPEEDYEIPLGKADVKRQGTDVTLVAYQQMVPRALATAAQLQREGISVEVIDLRCIRPLDEETILASIRKTNRLVIVHEAWKTCGIGAELSALAMEKAFDWLDAPVERVFAMDVPMPYNETLENEVIPTQQRIADAVRRSLAAAR